MLGTILLRFLLRLILGISVAMSATSPRMVASGFFRIHLWVLLGLSTVAALVAASGGGPDARGVLALAIASASVSYAGSVLWLYECHRAGRLSLLLLAALSLWAALWTTAWPRPAGAETVLFVLLDVVTSGLLMGSTLCAMFLGHWYLNTPAMRLEPLVRLVWLIGVSVGARAAIAGVGLAVTVAGQGWPAGWTLAALVLRWVAGLIGLLVLAVLARKTLEIPNTQSAMGSYTWE